MVSLNSLLIGFYALLSYSYSQRHTYLTLGSWKRDIGPPKLLTGIARKTAKHISSFFFSSQPSFVNPIIARLSNTLARLHVPFSLTPMQE
jgi:hypothetical protein